MKGTLQRPGCELYFEVTGNGPALVFAHGLGGNYLSWWQQIPYFSQQFTCITFSHRGFWPNPAVQEIPAISVFSDDLSALIDHLHLDTVLLVAQSFGGWTCIDYALHHQSRVRSLIMASTTGTLNYKALKSLDLKRMNEWEMRTEREKTALRASGIIPGAGSRMADEQPSLYYLFQHINELTPSKYKESLRTMIHQSRTLSPDELCALKFPLLFITGEEDLLFPPEAAAAASLVSGAVWKSIPKSGHSTYFEHAQHFNHIVSEFLSGVTP